MSQKLSDMGARENNDAGGRRGLFVQGLWGLGIIFMEGLQRPHNRIL